jgi:hypothetical protein
MEHQIDLQKKKKSPVDFRSQSQTKHGMQNSKQVQKIIQSKSSGNTVIVSFSYVCSVAIMGPSPSPSVPFKSFPNNESSEMLLSTSLPTKPPLTPIQEVK